MLPQNMYTKVINKEAVKFICLHLRRLWHCMMMSLVIAALCRKGPDTVRIAMIGMTLCAAVLSSFINLLKHYRQIRPVFSILSLMLIGYICLCLSDMINMISHVSSARLSQTAWQGLFIILGFVEFFVCGCPRQNKSDTYVLQSLFLRQTRLKYLSACTTRRVSFVKKDALTFIYSHLSRLLFCFLVGHVLIDLYPNISNNLKVMVSGTSLCMAAMPSFMDLIRSPFLKDHGDAFSILYFLFVAYIMSCFGGAMELTTASSVPLSQVVCQCLFISVEMMEFYICRRPKLLIQQETSK